MAIRDIRRVGLSLLLVVSFVASAFAQNYPKPLSPQRLVTDFANMLSPDEEQALEQKLVNFSDTTSNQIAIVTVESLDGQSAAQYATGLAHEWGIGEDGNDNGVLILLKPKTTFSKGEVYIAVGYGLEGAIPDVMCSRIIRNTLIPAFQQNRIYLGLDRSVDTLIALSSGEYTASAKDGSGGIPIGLVTVVLVIIVCLLQSFTRSRHTSRNIDGTHGGTTVMPPFWFFPMMGGGSRSSWGSGSSNDFGGGFGGGGFGGFGGGGFGGGGAGGSW